MAFSVQKFIKSILVREENTITPKEMEFVPGGSASTKTILTTSQTANRTLTLPDATDTLVGLTAAQALSNKTIDGTNNTLSNIPTSALSGTIDASSIGSGTVDNTEFGYLNGVTSGIQTQIGNKASAILDNLGTTAINANLLPASDSTKDLGSSSLAFNDIYMNNLKFGGNTILSTTSLYSTGGAASVLFVDRKLYNALGQTVIDWEQQVLSKGGTPVLDFNSTTKLLLKTVSSQISSGSASAPGSPSTRDVYYDNTDNTYKFYNGTSWVSMSAGGISGTGTVGTIPKFSATSTLTDSVIVESSGNIGIGGSPGVKLDVSGTSGVSQRIGTGSSSFYIQHNGTTDTHLYTVEASSLRFGTTNTERVLITSNGNFTINTATSGSSLIVGGSALSGGTTSIVSSSGAIALGISDNVNSSLYIRPAAGGTVIGTDSGGALRFATGGNTTSDVKVELSSSGNLGIGVSPNQRLEVHGASGVTQRIGTNTSSFYIQHNGTTDTHLYTAEASDLRFGTNSSERLKITSSGEIITSATGGTSGSGSPAIASGTYTPTAASLTGGVSAVTPKVCHWMRIGNIVTVGLILEITSSTAGSFTLTLPTTTANFSSALQAQGIIGTHGAVVSGKITSTTSAQTITVNATSSLTGITYDGTITYQVQ